MPPNIDYTGLDYDSTIIDVAKQQRWDWNCNFIQGDINKIDLGQYDTIIAFEIIEHKIQITRCETIELIQHIRVEGEIKPIF